MRKISIVLILLAMSLNGYSQFAMGINVKTLIPQYNKVSFGTGLFIEHNVFRFSKVSLGISQMFPYKINFSQVYSAYSGWADNVKENSNYSVSSAGFEVGLSIYPLNWMQALYKKNEIPVRGLFLSATFLSYSAKYTITPTKLDPNLYNIKPQYNDGIKRKSVMYGYQWAIGWSIWDKERLMFDISGGAVLFWAKEIDLRTSEIRESSKDNKMLVILTENKNEIRIQFCSP